MDDDDTDTEMALLIEAALEDRLTHDGGSTMASTFLCALGRINSALGMQGSPTTTDVVSRVLELRRERDAAVEALAKLRADAGALAARVDGAVAKADLLRDVARHERDVYAHVIARLRAALRLDASASISAVVKRAEELAALQVGRRVQDQGEVK